MDKNTQLIDLLNDRCGEIKKFLPSHIDVNKFIQICNLAVLTKPELMDCDQKSLFSAFIDCAKDGLVPDGREAFINIFNTKVKINGKDEWIQKAQYQTMVDGLLKKVRQSGEVLSIVARAVFVNDEFDYFFDENGEHIKYKPCLDGNSGDFRLTFAYAKLKSGDLVVEVMTKPDVDRVRAASKTGKYGPWADWYDRMAIKSVLHRLGRRLPNSAEMLSMIERDIDIVKVQDQQKLDVPLALPSYQEDAFLKNKEMWYRYIHEKGMEPQEIIDTVSNKWSLSEKQQEEILDLKQLKEAA